MVRKVCSSTVYGDRNRGDQGIDPMEFGDQHFEHAEGVHVAESVGRARPKQDLFLLF